MLPSALQPKPLLEPCVACGGRVYSAFMMHGEQKPYTLRSGVKMLRTLYLLSYCEDCKNPRHIKPVMVQKGRNDPPVNMKIVQVLKMLRRGGWDPWKPPPVSL